MDVQLFSSELRCRENVMWQEQLRPHGAQRHQGSATVRIRGNVAVRSWIQCVRRGPSCSDAAGGAQIYVRVVFRGFSFLFSERGEGRERDRERNISMWLPLTCPPTGDLARNPGVCPDWESNRRPFGSQARTQSTELHQPGLRESTLYEQFSQTGDQIFVFSKSLA